MKIIYKTQILVIFLNEFFILFICHKRAGLQNKIIRELKKKERKFLKNKKGLVCNKKN